MFNEDQEFSAFHKVTHKKGQDFFKQLVFEKGVVNIQNGSALELKSFIQLGDVGDLYKQLIHNVEQACMTVMKIS